MKKIKEFLPSSWSIDNKTSIYVITVIISLWGLWSYNNLQKENFPDIEIPTILTGVTGEMVVAREETFGPVVAVYQVEDNDEAVALANDSHYGLNASVWSARHGREVGRRLLAGTVNVNDGYSAAWASHDAPMGGMKDSGVGRRHGREGILKYTEAQTVASQRLVPVGPPPGMTNERYTRLVKGALTLMGRLR